MYPEGYEIKASFELDMADWGNAVPYTSQSHEKRGSRKHGQVKRYKDYKKWLAFQLMQGQADGITMPGKGEKVYLYVHCYFKDYTHGDPENCRKAIQDAIYTQDKYVAGCVDFSYDKDNPRVMITILEAVEELTSIIKEGA
jgi:hypothetical protein